MTYISSEAKRVDAPLFWEGATHVASDAATDVVSADSVCKLIELMRAEYEEMPGLALTKPQVRRLWGVECDTCDALLDEMVRRKFLRKTAGNLYVRAGNGR
jgi:hypothetical protein